MTLEYSTSEDVNDESINIIPSFVSIFIYKCLELSQFTSKLKLFEMSLYSVFRVLSLDYIKNNVNFNQKPYLKILTNLIKLFYESNSDELNEPHKKYQYFAIITDFLKLLKPSNFSGFSFAWLELIGNSMLISQMIASDGKLNDNDKKILIIKQEKYCELLSESLSYLSTKSDDIMKDFNTRFYFDQVIRLFYLLSHSYPEFFISYYIPLITSLPITQGEFELDGFVQLKNIILSASTSTAFIDFFKEDFKIENIPDTKKTPIINFDVISKLKEKGFKDIIDDILLNKNSKRMEELINKISMKDNSVVYYYLTCYIGVTIKSWFESKQLTYLDLLEFFSRILKSLNDDGRNAMIQAILTEVKCLCSTTYFYVMLILSIVLDGKNEVVEENIIRNILLKIMVKPYPSGFIWMVKELFKHQKYDIIIKKLVKNNPKFDHILEEVNRFIQESYNTLENYI